MAPTTSHLEWFANNVPYHVSRRNIDLLIYHRTPVGELIDPPFRYRYAVVELKKDASQRKDVDQVVDYANWVAGRLVGKRGSEHRTPLHHRAQLPDRYA